MTKKLIEIQKILKAKSNKKAKKSSEKFIQKNLSNLKISGKEDLELFFWLILQKRNL